jgi:hypothetical protein
MKYRLKKVIALVTVFVLMFSMLPVDVLAAQTPPMDPS